MVQQRDWNLAARRLVRMEMRRRDLNFIEFAKRLERVGVQITNVALSNKVARGTFSAAFFLQCMRALDADVVRLFDREVDALKSVQPS